MDRSHVVEQLSLYADGMLTAAEAERVRTHLAACADCRGEWEALQHTLALLRSLPAEEPPADLTAAIMARVRAEAATTARRSRFGRGSRWAMTAAAAVFVLFVAGLVADRWSPSGPGVLSSRPETVVADRHSAGAGLSGVAGEGFAGAAVPPPAEVAADGAVSGAPAPAPGSAGLSTLSSVPAAQRRVIHTAYVTLRVDNVEDAYAQVLTLTEAAGGFVQEAFLSDDGPGIILPPVERRAEPLPKSAYLVLRVPTPRFEAFVRDVLALGKPGEPRDHRTSASDITTEYVDVEARLRNLQAKESRLLEILAGAGNVTEILEVERELWQTRAEAESLQARLNAWNELLDLATLHLNLHTAGVSPPEREHSVGQRLLLAFYQAVDYLVVGVETMIVGAGVVLPWAVLAGIVWLVYRWRRRGRSPAP